MNRSVIVSLVLWVDRCLVAVQKSVTARGSCLLGLFSSVFLYNKFSFATHQFNTWHVQCGWGRGSVRVCKRHVWPCLSAVTLSTSTVTLKPPPVDCFIQRLSSKNSSVFSPFVIDSIKTSRARLNCRFVQSVKAVSGVFVSSGWHQQSLTWKYLWLLSFYNEEEIKDWWKFYWCQNLSDHRGISV